MTHGKQQHRPVVKDGVRMKLTVWPRTHRSRRAIDAAIEHLGQMWDAVQDARNRGDSGALANLAEEYRALGCPAMAKEVEG